MSTSPRTTPPDHAVVPERHPKSPETGTQIPSHYGHCFGCGELHPTGLHLVAHVGEGVSITSQFTVSEHHQGAPGLAHGGLLTLAFDETHGKLLWLLRAPAVTAHLETDFKLPVPIGSTIYIKARIVGQAGRKVFSSAEGHLNSPDGPIAVTSSSLFIIVPMSHFLENAPKEYIEHLRKHPELLAYVDPDFEINP